MGGTRWYTLITAVLAVVAVVNAMSDGGVLAWLYVVTFALLALGSLQKSRGKGPDIHQSGGSLGTQVLRYFGLRE